VAVGALFIALGFFGPDWHKWEAEFKCLPDYRVETVYPDMVQCSKAIDASSGRGCGCTRPENPWARIYSNYFVPPILGVAAWLLLAGSLPARIGHLNAGFWGAIFLLGVFYSFTNSEGVESLALSFGHLLYVALVASFVLVVLSFVSRGLTSLFVRT
jgi:hypothetical protein